ncbi:hypothetical protein BHM03_00015338 [Ensete ventricosum]|nr:hypothetical protein BHM03_00015338 [Ensete ventricosum]
MGHIDRPVCTVHTSLLSNRYVLSVPSGTPRNFPTAISASRCPPPPLHCSNPLLSLPAGLHRCLPLLPHLPLAIACCRSRFQPTFFTAACHRSTCLPIATHHCFTSPLPSPSAASSSVGHLYSSPPCYCCRPLPQQPPQTLRRLLPPPQCRSLLSYASRPFFLSSSTVGQPSTAVAQPLPPSAPANPLLLSPTAPKCRCCFPPSSSSTILAAAHRSPSIGAVAATPRRTPLLVGPYCSRFLFLNSSKNPRRSPRTTALPLLPYHYHICCPYSSALAAISFHSTASIFTLSSPVAISCRHL